MAGKRDTEMVVSRSKGEGLDGKMVWKLSDVKITSIQGPPCP